MNTNFNYSQNKAVINRGKSFGMLNGVFTKNTEIMDYVYKMIKAKKAKKVVDNEKTLMYVFL